MDSDSASLGGTLTPIGENHCSGSLAPGGPARPAANVVALDYAQDFPGLGAPGANGHANPLDSNTSNAWPVKKTKPVVTTQIFHLAGADRKLAGEGFGESRADQNVCNNIAEQTGTEIELSEARDGSLTIVVTGKRDKVEDARRAVLSGLQQQGQRDIPIPKEHHKVIIGRGGEKLADIERQTDCKITVPSRDSSSNFITIKGPKDGIDKAVAIISLASEVESGRDQTHIVCPRIFYPWIRGPADEVVNKIKEDNRVLIHIPPPQANSEVINIVGDKDGVHKAAATLRAIIADKETKAKSITCKIACAQHRYVIGPQRSGLDEVLRTTGVSVEVPPAAADDDTITLRGDPARLGEALAIVYARAASNITHVMDCPQWLHKFIIGQKGANIKQLTADMPKIQINFTDDQIILDGAPEDVNRAQEALAVIVAKLKTEMEQMTLKVHPQYHRHVIGKNGSNISKLKQETGVLISIPDPDAKDDRRKNFGSPEEIRIEGSAAGVKKAAQEITDIVKRLENEKSKDIIVEQRFHKIIIGSKGENISKLRSEFPSVNISFPEQGRKSDIVTLRGDKAEVDKMAKNIMAQVKDLQESNFQVRVPIFKDFHKNIIGKGGATIRKIREETETRIELPSEASGDDAITVTGKKAAVEKAVAALQKIQNELASVVTMEVTIPKKLHSRLIGGGGRLIQDISEQCGGAQIKFPEEKTTSDKVTVRGPQEEAEKAAKLLQELAKDKELASHEEGIKSKPEYFRFLIGRGGSKIRKLRDSYPNVRILFPRPQDTDQETIHLVGKKEEVGAVRKMLEELIAELGQREEGSVEVEPKYHKHFVARGAAVLREIQDSCGGVSISFPKMATGSSTVALVGSKDGIAEAKARITEIVDDLDCQVTVAVPILAEFHRSLLGNRGMKIQKVCADHNVQIKFPERLSLDKQPAKPKAKAPKPSLSEEPQEEEAKEAGSPGSPSKKEGRFATLVNKIRRLSTKGMQNGGEMNGGGEEAAIGGDASRDVVHVSGRPERCDAAAEALKALVPVSKAVPVPFEFHRSIIGKGGAEVRELMNAHDVNVSVPRPEERKDEITITGSEAAVQAAIEDIQGRIGNIEDMVRDRELRRFQHKISIPAEYHPRIIGPRGASINALRDKFQVEISLPGGQRPNINNNSLPELTGDEILIVGYEEKAKAAAQEMEDMIEELKNLFSQEITLDGRIHPRIIGAKGRNIRKLMEDFGVDIKLPRGGDDPNLVTVSGKEENAVFDCIDHLRQMEEEMMEEVVERERYQAPKRQEPKAQAKAPQAVQFTGPAPWNPGQDGEDNFPSLGGGPTNGASTPAAPQQAFGAWGRRN